jgi:hypothetical protein
MVEQRRAERRSCADLINVHTETRKDRAGVVRDVSENGLRFMSRSKYALGERVEVLIHVSQQGYKKASGRIVRTSLPPQYDQFFPHPAAIEFDGPMRDA